MPANDPARPLKVSLRTELSGTLRLAWPIVLAQVGHMSMGIVDTLVAGRLGTTTVAGLGLATNVFWTFTSVSLGCLLSLDTFFSQSVGANDDQSLARYLGQSWWSAIVVTLASLVFLVCGTLLYQYFASPSEVSRAFASYMWNILWCTPTIFIFFILQRYWQARSRVMPFMVIILAANVLNLGACYALGLGWFGFPALGVKGIAWATNISRYAMLAAAILFTYIAMHSRFSALPSIIWPVQKRIFLLGFPAAGQTALEIGAFTLATFVTQMLGAASLAAHHICLMMAAFTFMFPLGFSAAAAVQVGTHIGEGSPERARTAGWLCIGLSITVMTCFAAGYLLIPQRLLRLFTQDPEVIRLGTGILTLVALFQIADGIQVSATGALRGLGNTRSAMLANLIGHYPIGLALGLLLCFGAGKGVVGLWCGLACGIISVAVLVIRAWRTHTRNLAELVPVARS